MSSPKSKTGDVPAAQPGEALLGRVLQVVGALVVDHHGQYEPSLQTVHVLCKATTLVLTAVCVEPVRVEIMIVFLFMGQKAALHVKPSYVVNTAFNGGFFSASLFVCLWGNPEKNKQ